MTYNKEIITLVNRFFNNEEKAKLWYNTENPLLGNISPSTMVKIGRIEKLKLFINHALEGNESP